MWKSASKPHGARLLPVDKIVEKKAAFHRQKPVFFFNNRLFTFPQAKCGKVKSHSLIAGVDVGGDVADDGGGFAVVPQEILHLADGA